MQFAHLLLVFSPCAELYLLSGYMYTIGNTDGTIFFGNGPFITPLVLFRGRRQTPVVCLFDWQGSMP